MIAGAATGIVAVLFNLADLPTGNVARLVGQLAGSIIGGALMFGFVAKLRNRAVLGAQTD